MVGCHGEPHPGGGGPHPLFRHPPGFPAAASPAYGRHRAQQGQYRDRAQRQPGPQPQPLRHGDASRSCTAYGPVRALPGGIPSGSSGGMACRGLLRGAGRLRASTLPRLPFRPKAETRRRKPARRPLRHVQLLPGLHAAYAAYGGRIMDFPRPRFRVPYGIMGGTYCLCVSCAPEGMADFGIEILSFADFFVSLRPRSVTACLPRGSGSLAVISKCRL